MGGEQQRTRGSKGVRAANGANGACAAEARGTACGAALPSTRHSAQQCNHHGPPLAQPASQPARTHPATPHLQLRHHQAPQAQVGRVLLVQQPFQQPLLAGRLAEPAADAQQVVDCARWDREARSRRSARAATRPAGRWCKCMHAAAHGEQSGTSAQHSHIVLSKRGRCRISSAAATGAALAAPAPAAAAAAATVAPEYSSSPCLICVLTPSSRQSRRTIRSVRALYESASPRISPRMAVICHLIKDVSACTGGGQAGGQATQVEKAGRPARGPASRRTQGGHAGSGSRISGSRLAACSLPRQLVGYPTRGAMGMRCRHGCMGGHAQQPPHGSPHTAPT